eukprot:CAMPEP_0115147514 /NCGR_PEP_ID=MMETSP0227-20121206/63357_1 /TAXON_ID=89957 /ORGANISM="Polarella glacialis, Strain CCMP 1383" /LENGTH=128 /DNA_ID=CAMNT_0002557439 /DNA_START=298 /DNA_END=684 /DNA_ORIENTATION=-
MMRPDPLGNFRILFCPDNVPFWPAFTELNDSIPSTMLQTPNTRRKEKEATSAQCHPQSPQSAGISSAPTRSCITGSRAKKGEIRDISPMAYARVSEVLMTAFKALEAASAAQKPMGRGRSMKEEFFSE